MARIVILAEPSELFEFVGHALTKEGHHVQFLRNLGLLVSKMTSLLPDLVIIDAASWPSTMDDVGVLVRHRHAHRVRTLILEIASDGASGKRSAIKADALQRPLHPSSLITRVEVLLARESVDSPADDCLLGQITVADLVIAPISFQVTRSGRRLSLSLSEFRLLYYLASNPNMVFRRNHLLKVAVGNRATRPRTVDHLVQHLREQIEEDPKKPRLIQSVRAQGYRFCTSTQPATTTLPADAVPLARVNRSSEAMKADFDSFQESQYGLQAERKSGANPARKTTSGRARHCQPGNKT